MLYNFYKKNLWKKSITFVLCLFFVSSVFYAPLTAKKAEALIPVFDIKQVVIDILDGVAMAFAQKLVDETVKSTIRWANTGFDGNPAYVTDPEGYLKNFSSGFLGERIGESEGLGFLCSPFQAQVKLSLVKTFVPETQYQCTIEQIGGNYENFVNNFEEGGWDAWFAVTQSQSSNPYGAFLTAKADLNRELQEALDLEESELTKNTGFLSKKVCDGERNPDYSPTDKQRYQEGTLSQERLRELEVLGVDLNKPPGACLGTERITTPGHQIKEALDGSVLSGVNRLMDVDSFNQLIGAFATGLLNRYVIGSNGVFSSNFSQGFDGSSGAKLPQPKFGWIFCANEGEFCAFDGETRVRMNVIGTSGFLSRATQRILDDVEDGVMCTAEEFDVQSSGYASCSFYGQTKGPYNPDSDETGWVLCAEEGSRCNFSGIKQVRYGTPGGFTYYLRVGNGGIQCSNSTFGGDPSNLNGNSEPNICEYKQLINPLTPTTPTAPTTPTTNPTNNPILYCYPSTTQVGLFEEMIWTADSTYPENTSYLWFGDEIFSSFGPLNSIVQSYSTFGIKNAFVTVRQPNLADVTVNCAPSVEVTSTRGSTPLQ